MELKETNPRLFPSLEAIDTQLDKLDLAAYAARARPRYQWYRHCLALKEVLQRVLEGTLRRVLIIEPPRHGKSELVSRLFTGHYLATFPDRWVGLVSYGDALAFSLSRAARDNFLMAGGALNPLVQSVGHWETRERGGLWSAGIGGAIVGKGFHLGVIDDPIKNAEDAASTNVREKQREWYQSVFTTREEPQGALVVIQTRWHREDLMGWLLQQEADEEPERWHVVYLPALACEPPEFPDTVSLEPDWREPGEPLCPERYPLDKLLRLRKRLGSYYWSSLYQGYPVGREGGMFKAAWLQQAIVEDIQEEDKPPEPSNVARR